MAAGDEFEPRPQVYDEGALTKKEFKWIPNVTLNMGLRRLMNKIKPSINLSELKKECLKLSKKYFKK